MEDIMKGNFTTEYGTVFIDNNVIAKVAGLTAVECFGIVGMAALSKRDGIVKMLTRNSLAKGVMVTVEPDGLAIDFHVIVSYGIAISTIADNLVEAVRYQVENITNFKVKKINIVVEGVRVID